MWLASCSSSVVKRPVLLDDVIIEPQLPKWKLQQKELEKKLYILDSLETPKEKATELYLISLDNFIHSGLNDNRIPKMIMWRADYFFENSLYGKAIENYRILVSQYQNTPYFIDAMKRIAHAYARNGELENAQTWYKKLRKHGNDSLKKEARNNIAEIMFRDARELEKNNFFQKAAEKYFQITTTYPEVEIAPRALIFAGKMRMEMKEWKEAVDLLKDFHNKFYDSPLVPEALYYEARSLEKQNKFKQSAGKYLALVKAFPSSPEAERSLLKAGISFQKANLPIAAALTFNRFSEVFPKNKNACNALLHAKKIFKETGKYEQLNEIKFKYKELCKTIASNNRKKL